MSDRTSLQETPAAPGKIGRPRRAGRYVAAALALALIAAAAWITGEKLTERARDILEELLSRYTGEPAAIERLVIVSPSRAVLEGLEIGPLVIEELRLDLSPAALLRRDPYRAVKGLSVAGGRLKLDHESAEHEIGLRGRISLEPAGGELRIHVVEGALEIDSREWEVEGEAYVSPQGLSRFNASLVPGGGASGRVEADAAAVPASRGYEVRLRWDGIELPFAWALAGPFLFPEQFEEIPAPQSGVAGFHVTIRGGASGELKAEGEAAIEGLAWDFVASERAVIEGTYAAAPRPAGTEGSRPGPGGREYAAEARVELGAGRIFHHAVASLEAEIHGAPDGWRIARAAAEGSGGARYRLDGALPKGQVPYVAVTGEGVPLREALLWLGGGESCLDAQAAGDCRVPWPLFSRAAGTASGSVRAAWKAGGLSLEGTIDLEGAWLGSTRLSEGAVEFSWTRGVTELSGRLGLGGGRVSTASIAARERALSGEILVEDVALPALESLLREAGVDLPVERWRGRVTGRVLLEGGPDSPVVRFDLVGERAGFGEIAVDRANVAGAWRPGLWEIEAAGAEGPGDLRLSAKGRIHAGGGVDLELDWTGLAAGLVGTYLGNSLLESVDARVDGTLRVWDDGGGPSIAGRATARAESAGYELDAALHLDGRIGEIITAEGAVSAGGGTASVRSEWTAGSNRLAAELERFPLAALAGLWGGTGVEGDASGTIDFIWPRGRALRGSARVDVPRLRLGTVVIAQALAELDLESPAQDLRRAAECGSCLFGEGRITGKIEPAGRSGRPSDVEIVAAFRGDEVELAPVSVSLWGGRATLWGGARQHEGGWRIDLRSEGTGLRYARSGAAATFDYRASLEGPVDALKAFIRAGVKQGEVDLFQLPPMQAGSRGGSKTAGASRPAALPSRLDLDVQLDIDSLRVRARSLLDGVVSGSVRLTGVLGQLHATGELEVARGYFGYLGRRFDVERGRVAFYGATLIPHLDVTGRTRARDLTLYVDVTGPADNLALSLRSDPPASGETLRELMMEPLGAHVSGDWRALASVLAAAVNQQVVSEVYWTIGKALEDALQVDWVDFARGEGEQLELRVGKYVTPELYLAYRKSLSGKEGESVSLEYSAGRRLTLRTAWDHERGSLVEAGMSLPF